LRPEFLEASLRNSLLALLIVISALAAAPAAADGVRFWKIDSRKDLLAGESDGVSVLADESLELAPELKLFAQPRVPYIWAMAPDGRGGAYVGTGHEGKVYHLSPAGDTTLVFDALEPEITSLAVGGNGDLYVGASPEGRVYRIPGGKGEAEVYFDPDETYLWDMLTGPGGELYVAVGFTGKVYKVTGENTGKVILETTDQHILTMALDRKGNLLAGSAGNALLYEVSPAGQVSIIYDSPLNDIRSIVADKDNNLYVAALEIKPGSDQGQGVFSQPSDAESGKDSSSQDQSGEQEGQDAKRGLVIRPPTPRLTPPTNSEIYFFDQDRFVTRIWRESGDAIMSLGLSPDGQAMFVASQDKRSLYKIDKRGEPTVLGKFGSGEVTDYLDLGSRILICTHNPGRVHVLEGGFIGKGTFTSEVQQAGIPAQWGVLSWLGETPPGTKISFRTRSGNTDKPDTTWSGWSAPLRGTSDETISSPVRRNFQWQAILETTNPKATPNLVEVSVSYLRRNRPPMISPVRLMPQGLYIKPSSSPLDEGGMQKYPQEVAQLIESSNGSTDNPFQGKKEYERRVRMAGWNANDANGDKLLYTVYYKGIKESEWRKLAEKIESNSVIFDTETIADGRYELKVVACDSLDNAAGRALTAERISAPFFVDNTAPAIHDLKAEKQPDGRVTVSFRVVDATTRIERVELAFDSEPERLLAPVDNLLDTEAESFSITLDKPARGEHTVSIMAWDRFFNRAAARVSFKVD
jgi:sugar lactone lactonase YvrE